MLAHLIQSPPMDVFSQMACDEVLARSGPSAFCLRFYRWSGPALTFGYAQRFSEVEALDLSIAKESWTRRPTGGGVVPHLDDLTFSCVFPDSSGPSPIPIYQRLHEALRDALQGCGIPVELSASAQTPFPGNAGGASQCFADPVSLDLMENGRKILGGAIRRYGTTVLYQASLQRDHARKSAADLEKAIACCLGEAWGLQWDSRPLDPDLLAEMKRRAAVYRSPEWVQRR